MMESMDKTKLIREEQEIVDKLIRTLENEITNQDQRLQNILWNYQKAKEQGPDAYGIIVKGISEKVEALNGIERAKRSKDELYTCRVILECTDDDGRKSELELKIGLSTYMGKNKNILVCDWKRDVCRHFILDNCAEEYDGMQEDRGIKYRTHYKLKLKRNVDTRFSHVRDVTHLFPLSVEEAAKLIYDSFLSELASRRDNVEFQNIIFSIQKKQGEIIGLPYNEDIIVQGCAGSGKSMIMLHRLPILLYDHPDKLDSSNVYIISPSETYIQMVANMREELEITDLKMGTINQYYDYVLSKYGINLGEYGRVSYLTKVTKEQEEYIYNKELCMEIHNLARNLISECNCDYSEGLILFNLPKRKSVGSMVDAEITDYILMGNSIISANNAVLRDYYNVCNKALSSAKEITDKLRNRRISVWRSLARIIEEQNELIRKAEKELTDTSLGEKAIDNRKKIIEEASSLVKHFTIIQNDINRDDVYFQNIADCENILNELLEEFENIKPLYEDNSKEVIYSLLSRRKTIYKGYHRFVDALSGIEDKYCEYSDSLIEFAQAYENTFKLLLTKNDIYLEAEYLDEIISSTDYYTDLKQNIATKVYLEIMKKCGQVPNEKNEIKALHFSPYLYLRIIFELKGSPNATKEKLICIDEAQGVAPVELDLIRKLNGERLIFNLYGDIKQHIEGTKGIDSWDEFHDTIIAKEKLLMENYRNASQITEECNRRFNMEMVPINTPGSGVTNISSFQLFDSKMHELLLNVSKPGSRAIIVNDTKEAKFLIKRYREYQEKLHDMTSGSYDFHRTRWNLLTVEQAKGLEFGTVVVLAGRMTQNRKYIALTRALEELYVLNIPLHIDEDSFIDEVQSEKRIEKKINNTKEKKKDKEKKISIVINYANSQVRKFFESKGVEVNDMRPQGGALWIIGEQAEIKQFVDEASEKFGITGIYSRGKATGFRNGCYFKTKK